MKYYNWIVIALMFGLGVWLYPILPALIPTHWGVSGQVDGYMRKEIGVWLLPLIVLAMNLMFGWMPRLDPKKDKYKLFAREWKIIQGVLVTFFGYIFAVSLYIALNQGTEMLPFMFVGLGSLFIVMGNYLSKIRQNYFIGVKLPWTLADEDNWNKTHRYASWTFVVAGIVTLAEAKLQWYAPGIVFAGIMLAAFLPMIYSYLLFKKTPEKMKYIYLGLALVAILMTGARLSTPEDSWICSGGEWVQHGKPSAPRPEGECK